MNQHSFLSSSPDYSALHLETDEHVILEVRKHWIVFAGHAAGLLLAAFFPFIVMVLFRLVILNHVSVLVHGSFSLPDFAPTLFTFFYTLWILFLWISFFVGWTKYYLDVWYVTEKRIIAVEQKRIFDREISNIRFDRIQDVTVEVDGFIPTFLDFGNIKVQTASEDDLDFIMNIVRHPDEVRRVIFSQHNEIGDGKQGVGQGSV